MAEEADAERDERERAVRDEPRLAAEEHGQQRSEQDHSRDGRRDIPAFDGASETASRTVPTPA